MTKLPKPIGATYTVAGVQHCAIVTAATDANLYTEEQLKQFGRDVEQALLEKLAGMGPPEPEPVMVMECDGLSVQYAPWDHPDRLPRGKHKLFTAAQLHQAYAQGAAQVFEQQAAEIEELRIDAECFRLWVHEAWHSPGDICRLLMNCETPEDYRAKLVPLIEGQRAAIGKAMG